MYGNQRSPWLMSIVNMPLYVRLCACLFSTPICVLIYALTFTNFYDSRILVVPMLIWAWTFGKRGAFIYGGSFMVGVCSYYLLSQRSTLHLPVVPASLLINIPVMAVVAVVVIIFKNRQADKITEPLRVLAEENKQQRQMAAEQVRQFEQIKTQFLINVNHELRTPLTATYSYFELLEMLLEQQGHLDYKDHGMYLRDALRYCEQLRSIVNNILDTLDIDNTQPVYQGEPCNVAQVILDTCTNLDIVQREQYRIHIQVSSNLYVQSNTLYLRHILHQLLSNAFKYTPPGSPIIIRAELDPAEEHTICISIKDRGPGIPFREQAHIFDQFARLPRDIAGTVRGTGLGLYICKQLVERMHGYIWVESSGLQGRGCCFRFTLPQATVTPTGNNQLPTDQAQAF
ncbi:hypothetical protein KDH_45370 [Dictyobacter sp. S3.2.2.5]|uniref:histidine kinase n=1 Tax=Dictyobacter halimunensis TaxID=3026934 RepID=A0ABQ6FYT1_9CHLR|nr:hypothetical protein KDH_45370 [Dictyobacter sp. S3.2.2.5]